MIYIPGGDFTMGSDHHYAEEKPAHRVKVGGFWIDNAPVTNAEFKHFDSEEKDGKCNPGFDGWRRNVDVVEVARVRVMLWARVKEVMVFTSIQRFFTSRSSPNTNSRRELSRTYRRAPAPARGHQ